MKIYKSLMIWSWQLADWPNWCFDPVGIFRSLKDKFMCEKSKALLKTLDVEIADIKAPIETLFGWQRLAVAIARAFYWQAKLMTMGEPTNNLGVPEKKMVLKLINNLREHWVLIILNSHNISDVFLVADRLVVMPRGHKATEKKNSESSSDEFVRFMVAALDDSRAVREMV